MVEEKKGLMEQMDALVREHLPEKVGAMLREELNRLQEVEQELKAAKDLLEAERADVKRLRAQVIAKEALEKREGELEIQTKELQGLRIELEKQDAVQKALQAANAVHIQDMVGVVHAVFANNKFKYERRGYQDVYVPPYKDPYGGCGGDSTRMCSHDETVEGEGDVPPMAPPAPPPVAPSRDVDSGT